MEKHSERVERLRSYVQRDPDNVDLAVDLIRTAAAEQGIEAALEFAASLGATVTGSPQYAHAVGTLLLEARRPAEAEPFLRQVLDAVPGNPDVAYNLAFSLYQQQRFVDALAEIDAVGDGWRESPAIQLLKARCLHHVEEFDGAAHAAKQFIDLHPGHLEATGLLSLILADAGRHDEALEVSADVLRDRPEQLDAMLARASSSIAAGDYDTAGDALSTVKAQHPEIGRVQVIDGQLNLLQNNHAEAITAFRAATELMPNHLGSWHLLAWCQLLVNDIAAARESFQSALEVDRNFAESHGGIAVTEFLAGNFDAAQAAADRAKGLNRHCLSGLYAQSLLDEHSGETGRAARMIEKIFKTPTGERAQELIPIIAAHRAERMQSED